MSDKKPTYVELASLGQFFKSSTIGDLQISYKTYMAIKAIAKVVDETLQPIRETETKYISDSESDEQYQEFVTGENLLRKGKPEDLNAQLMQYSKESSHLIENQRKRTQEFQELLNSEVDVGFDLLTEGVYPDLFAAELTTVEWEILSLVLA